MLGEPIEYTSGTYLVNNATNILESKSHHKIKCTWTKRILLPNPFRIIFTWKFDWNKLKNQGVDKITGYITLFSVNNAFTAMKMNLELTKSYQEFTNEFGYDSSIFGYDKVYYAYCLTPHYNPISEKPDYDKMFAPSDQNDTILVVDGKKLHVSKAVSSFSCKISINVSVFQFLSYHSEYFRALFSSNFKEGQMDEIPIGEVSYEDFALLLRTFYPDPVFVTDATVEKILEMARRFLVSSVIKVTEHHLLNMSKINNEKMLRLADEYGMQTLLDKSIRGLDTLAKAKQMKKSQKYEQLSDKTKLKVFDRLMDFV
ncbi:hypothetical protein CRE_17653 [Caenorhabditis remanei]|uniref:BTB domain-containing protein n=1 Tax=Caenorhabditis remanei TaxID=31234 RepID=E3NMF1_CAERE|nr:hypothetical protein CRE_17653 [Caenorhabditis remanei]